MMSITMLLKWTIPGDLEVDIMDKVYDELFTHKNR